MIERQIVESNNIASVGYDPENKVLEIEFAKTSGLYRYYDVPQELFDGLLAAPSKGKFFYNQIKGKFDSMRQH